MIAGGEVEECAGLCEVDDVLDRLRSLLLRGDPPRSLPLVLVLFYYVIIESITKMIKLK